MTVRKLKALSLPYLLVSYLNLNDHCRVSSGDYLRNSHTRGWGGGILMYLVFPS